MRKAVLLNLLTGLGHVLQLMMVTLYFQTFITLFSTACSPGRVQTVSCTYKEIVYLTLGKLEHLYLSDCFSRCPLKYHIF